MNHLIGHLAVLIGFGIRRVGFWDIGQGIGQDVGLKINEKNVYHSS